MLFTHLLLCQIFVTLLLLIDILVVIDRTEIYAEDCSSRRPLGLIDIVNEMCQRKNEEMLLLDIL